MATMKEVYGELINMHPIMDVAGEMGISSQGLRHKCLRTQFLTKTEKGILISYLKGRIKAFEKIIGIVQEMAVRE